MLETGSERDTWLTGRAPFDRTTLQPGRRVSKAGLESLRPFMTVAKAKEQEQEQEMGQRPVSPKGTALFSSASPDAGSTVVTSRKKNESQEPVASPSAKDKGVGTITPRTDGRLNWI